jgi:uncharacterized protein (TIGR03382 family)
VYNLGGCGCSQTASPGLTAVFVLMATTWWGARRRRG